MQIAGAHIPESADTWSADEELTIAAIQEADSVSRAEAIRQMQRRKKAASSLPAWLARPTTTRLCRNPRCRRGDDGGPGSLAHLRADARYCDDTCKKAGQRSLRRENESSNRQYLRGSKRDKADSLAPSYCQEEHVS